MKASVYQIYYSDESRCSLDPGFIPLDNTGQRPDWREYWPMRKYLLDNALDDEAWYGFLSPKFKAKTNLTADDVYAYLAKQSADTDVVLFSPFFEQNAICLNVFEQASLHHPGIAAPLALACDSIAPGCNAYRLVQCSEQVVFCNYVVAKPRFWSEWLVACETLFAIAEANSGVLGPMLNEGVPYGDTHLPAKVFVIERIASLLLSIRKFKSRTVEIEKATFSGSDWSPHLRALVALDALKYAALGTGRDDYIRVFNVERNLLAETVNRERQAKKVSG